MGKKTELISIIKFLSIAVDEAVIDIHLDETIFHSIEWRRDGNQVILHKFIEYYDYEFNYDEMPKKLKNEIYLFLLRNFLN